MTALARHAATRYVQPLREGGSLPAVVDTAAGGLFVVKFRGAGQGAKALIAELVVGQLAQILGLPGPELAIIELSAAFGQSEPDPEIQDILRGSHGVNVGLRYLDGAFNFDVAAAGDLVSSELATRLVWFDALVTNADRSHRNPNILVWRRSPWLIDHGGALYAHHNWPAVDEAKTRTAFPGIREHVLLDRAGDLAAVDAELAGALTADAIERVLAQVPAEPPDRSRELPRVLLGGCRSRPLSRIPAHAPAGPARLRQRGHPGARPAPARAGPPALRPPMICEGWIAYDFAVLRAVPHVHLGAFVPVGVVVHARTAGFLGMLALTEPDELKARVPDVDHVLLARYLRSCCAVASGDPTAGPVALAPPSERFHWLTAPRSDVLQSLSGPRRARRRPGARARGPVRGVRAGQGSREGARRQPLTPAPRCATFAAGSGGFAEIGPRPIEPRRPS